MNRDPLDAFFKPDSVAIIGASEKEKSVSLALVQNLLKGGYPDKIYPINPNCLSVHHCDKRCGGPGHCRHLHQLTRWLKKLSKCEAVILDDIGYVQQSSKEMEVLFTLPAERYERGSVMITSNLPFSK